MTDVAEEKRAIWVAALALTSGDPRLALPIAREAYRRHLSADVITTGPRITSPGPKPVKDVA